MLCTYESPKMQVYALGEDDVVATSGLSNGGAGVGDSSKLEDILNGVSF